MTFANLPGQLIVLVLGWGFTVYLGLRSNSRAEALKTRDKIVDKLEALSEWVEDELKRTPFDFSELETGFSGLLSQIELKIGHFNAHVGENVVDVDVLRELRGFEFSETLEENEAFYSKIRHASWNAIDTVEMDSNEKFFMKKGMLTYFNGFVHAFYGVIVGAASLLVVYCVGKLIVG